VLPGSSWRWQHARACCVVEVPCSRACGAGCALIRDARGAGARFEAPLLLMTGAPQGARAAVARPHPAHYGSWLGCWDSQAAGRQAVCCACTGRAPYCDLLSCLRWRTLAYVGVRWRVAEEEREQSRLWPCGLQACYRNFARKTVVQLRDARAREPACESVRAGAGAPS